MGRGDRSRPALPEEQPKTTKADLKDKLALEVSGDRMEARLSGEVPEGADRKQVQYAITEALKKSGVRYGMDAQAMRQAIEALLAGQRVQGLVVARGQAPVEGEDAVITPRVEFGAGVVGRVNKKGIVDFRDRGPIPTVQPGTVLATLKKGLRGEPGRDVLGKLVHPPEVRMLRLLPGDGVSIDDDGATVSAAVEGMPDRPEEERFVVQSVLDIAGDVDLNTGHIEFPGAVRVQGTIRSDFKVKCYGLTAETIEPRAIIDVKADVVVYGGIMGAVVRAGGNVMARFVRDARVVCNGDMNIDTEIIQSKLQAGGHIRVSGLESRIVDSHIAAIKGVQAGDVLCSRREATMIRIGVNPEFEKQYFANKRALESLVNQRDQIMEAVDAQKTELVGTEEELRHMIEAFHSMEGVKDREVHLTQINMIKPLREALKQGVAQGTLRLGEMVFEIQRLREQIARMEAVAPQGAIWLDVRGRAEQGVEIRTPRASLVLENTHQGFSAREATIQDKQTGEERPTVKLSRLRTTAA